MNRTYIKSNKVILLNIPNPSRVKWLEQREAKRQRMIFKVTLRENVQRTLKLANSLFTKSSQTNLTHLRYFQKPVRFLVVLRMMVISSRTIMTRVLRLQCRVQSLVTVTIHHILRRRPETTSSSGRLCVFRSHLHQFSRWSTIWPKIRCKILSKYWRRMGDNYINQRCQLKLKSQSLMRFWNNHQLHKK